MKTVNYSAEYKVYAGWVVNEYGNLYWSDCATRDNRGGSEPYWYVELVGYDECKGHLPSCYLAGGDDDDYAHGWVTITADVPLDEFGDPDLCSDEWLLAVDAVKSKILPRKNTWRYRLAPSTDERGNFRWVKTNDIVLRRRAATVKSPNAW